MMDQEESKKKVAEYALQYIEDGMIIGLGTGTTAKCFIEALSSCIQKKRWSLRCVPSSIATEALARKNGIHCVSPDEVAFIDCTFDGADEVDSRGNIIKGGGGALFREKILAFSSKRFFVLIDSTKLVPLIGAFPLPVEVLPFGHTLTKKKLQEHSDKVILRKTPQGTAFITDNGNYIYDIHVDCTKVLPEVIEKNLLSIPGVIVTGLFLDYRYTQIIGCPDGEIQVKEPLELR